MVALFSNVLAVADVPEDVVKLAIEKAKVAVGIGHSPSEREEGDSSSQTGVSSPVGPPCSTGSEHSPKEVVHEHLLFERVAFGFVNASGKKDWCLASIDSLSSEGFQLSLFRPVPGRLGASRVAFFPPDEAHLVSATASDILPVPVVVSESMLDKDLVFVVHNHEEVDGVLDVAREII